MTTPKKAAKWGAACRACRRRKLKCDSHKPACSQCEKSSRLCEYENEARSQLRDALQRIEELERQLHEARLDHSSSRVDQPVNGDSLTAPSGADDGDGSGNETADYVAAEFSVDDQGRYYGSSSRFHPDLGEKGPRRSNEVRKEVDKINDEFYSTWLASSAHLQASWERLAVLNLQNSPGVTPALGKKLLDRFWTWQHPLHHTVYRRCFIRDMANGGPYFSAFLWNVICAHACRHLDVTDPDFEYVGRGESFMAKARRLLQVEMEQQRPKIPTIQGLLILGGRQAGVGNNSEGWLYTGMAIRILQDLGLELDPKKRSEFESLNAEDLEARKRLVISSYVWDKSISICLGRPPSLTKALVLPEELLDKSDDDQDWFPIGLEAITGPYPPTKSLITSCFSNHYRLSIITNQIYQLMYNGSLRLRSLASNIHDLEDQLRQFHRNLPKTLQIENASALTVCPPPHIFCLNILYFVNLILLYRPIMLWSRDEKLQKYGDNLVSLATNSCVEASCRINELLKAYGRTFKSKLQTYLLSYCVYTAATVDVYCINNPDSQISQSASARLAVTLEMLEAEARQTPGIQRSIQIIRYRLQKLPPIGQSQLTSDANLTSGLRTPSTGASASDLQTFPNEAALQHGTVLNTPTQGSMEYNSYQENTPRTLPNVQQCGQMHGISPLSHDQSLWAFPGSFSAEGGPGHHDLFYYSQDSPNSVIMQGLNASAGFAGDSFTWSF